MMATHTTTAPAPAAGADTLPAAAGPDADFDRYRHVVAAIFDGHRRAAGASSCSCGAAGPCPQEALAAELLDWI
ncbi:hypothetical protein ACPA54_30625 [Uniformispora flossi]|uniref:hypothetical protein n=1 Tax=Uniformispora flossi TaxID=3390723 RepID=UPI003C2CCF55